MPSSESSADEAEELPTTELTAAELFIQSEEKLAAKKQEISQIVSQLMQNPETNVLCNHCR